VLNCTKKKEIARADASSAARAQKIKTAYTLCIGGFDFLTKENRGLGFNLE